jgi:molybdopterin converting factor small subunit
MAVEVRMFAALRDAAGTGHALLEPGPLPALLEELSRRHGELFRQRLAISTVLVDGSPCRATDAVDVPDGAELALLPPVSGGAQG